MNDDGNTHTVADFPDDEYDELVDLIVNAEWNPGDIVRTSNGLTWRFRADPSTLDFCETNPHAPEDTSKNAFRTFLKQ